MGAYQVSDVAAGAGVRNSMEVAMEMDDATVIDGDGSMRQWWWW